MGPSIRASAVVMTAVLSFPVLVLAQADTPPPCPSEWQPPDPAVVWDSGSVRLEADAIEMRSGDCFFSGVGPAAVRSDPGDPTYRTLEVIWEEQGARVGMNIYFAADDDDWWVTKIRTPVGESRRSGRAARPARRAISHTAGRDARGRCDRPAGRVPGR